MIVLFKIPVYSDPSDDCSKYSNRDYKSRYYAKYPGGSAQSSYSRTRQLCILFRCIFSLQPSAAFTL